MFQNVPEDAARFLVLARVLWSVPEDSRSLLVRTLEPLALDNISEDLKGDYRVIEASTSLQECFRTSQRTLEASWLEPLDLTNLEP